MARYTDYVRKDLSPALGTIRLEQLTHHSWYSDSQVSYLNERSLMMLRCRAGTTAVSNPRTGTTCTLGHAGVLQQILIDILGVVQRPSGHAPCFVSASPIAIPKCRLIRRATLSIHRRESSVLSPGRTLGPM
jgi:hypothetical protein